MDADCLRGVNSGEVRRIKHLGSTGRDGVGKRRNRIAGGSRRGSGKQGPGAEAGLRGLQGGHSRSFWLKKLNTSERMAEGKAGSGVLQSRPEGS